MKDLIFEGKNTTVSSTLRNNSLIPSFFSKLDFEKMKDDILGKKYELSIVLTGKKRGRTLNKKFRDKDYATDVLSFELDKNSGEIFICPQVAKIKSKKHGMDFENYLLFIVIHGSLHLKGYLHGAKMSEYEFAYHSRYRRRHV